MLAWCAQGNAQAAPPPTVAPETTVPPAAATPSTPTPSATPAKAGTPAKAAPSAPTPIATPAPAAAAPTPVSAAPEHRVSANPPAHGEPPADEPPPRRTSARFGGGFAYFTTSDSGTGETQVAAPGIAIELQTTHPILEHWRANFRFNWGLTEFHRTEKLVETANGIGEWTTGAYASVFEWSTTKDDYALFRIMGSIFAYVGLLVPYAVAGVFYIMSPFAPTTYLGCDITGSYQLGDDDVHGYLEAGVGLVSYVHPKYGGLYGGVGPTLGVGVKLDFVNIGAHGTWSPPGAHGEPTSQSSNVYVGGLTATFGN